MALHGFGPSVKPGKPYKAFRKAYLMDPSLLESWPYCNFSSVAVHEMGLPRNAKTRGPGTLGRRVWKRLFGLSRRVLALLGFPCASWGPVHQKKFDEDIFFGFPLSPNKSEAAILQFPICRLLLIQLPSIFTKLHLSL